MKSLPAPELAQILRGELFGRSSSDIRGFATDNREVRPGDAFLAIRGAKVDGHQYVPMALEAGAAVAVVERPVDGPHILVPNLVDALARFGRHYRERFRGPVIGITGSAGKTTAKEFLASALEPLGKVLKTVGNRNTEYTAPLLWADLESDTAVVVVELAMRGFGQIAHLATFSQPTIGVITNIGYGHMEMVGDRAGIARAKGELLEALPWDGTAILWQEDEFLETLKDTAGQRTVRTFGFSAKSECRIVSYRPLDWQRAEVRGVAGGQDWTAVVPVVGRHISLNAAAAILAAVVAGVPAQAAADRLASAKLPPMRMEARELNGASLLVDTYNASPPAMLAAIETLRELPVRGRRVAVVGEMKELGEHTEALHREVGRALASLDAVLFYGAPMADFAREEAVSAGLRDARVAHSLEDVRAFLGELQPGDAALVKGSRALELERALEGQS
jgi:UDP-N-acetylmuramoyl-tripeptide--D-alanyl-D-alanine ligase